MTRLILIAAVGIGSSVLAAENAKREPRYEASTTVNFEDDTIEGELTRPDGEYVGARRRTKHSNLIRMREQFNDKVLQSPAEL